ncbi:uncharacterized protein LOC128886285 [Hylaeus anthracinus]|uniref:uncharacterized protein LOC128886285 n=1 Tax=Hylaeus anthracinus TaxID=313031 RepID=UPI0023B9A33E|nr:uncharacterized protein LOC128886285 [Hylaeus anthracinus]
MLGKDRNMGASRFICRIEFHGASDNRTITMRGFVQSTCGCWLISITKMDILTVLGFLAILQLDSTALTVAVDLDGLWSSCKDSVRSTPMMELKKYLFCQYDSTVRPVTSHKDINNVTLKLIPKILEFDEFENKMILHSWMTLVWMDSHLTWTPSKYDGIQYIHVKSSEIWVPDLSIYNSGDMSDDQSIPPTTCLIFSSGKVSCVPSMKHIAKCSTNYASWPYDRHRCRINFGSWSHSGEEVDFHLDEKGYQMAGYTNNSLWDFQVEQAYKVVKMYSCCPNDTYPMIVYMFSITRHHGVLQIAYVTPAIAMMLLTLTVLLLDSRSTERIAVASVNLICHMLCIFDMHWQLPHNGTNPPNLLLYYRDSLALAVFALILTALLRKMLTMNIEVPHWVSSTTSFVLSNRAGRFLVLGDEDSNRILGTEMDDNIDSPKTEATSKESSWRQLAAIIEWLSFFVVVITYVILLFTLMPYSSRFSWLDLSSRTKMKSLLFVCLVVLSISSQAAYDYTYPTSCKDITNSPMMRLRQCLLEAYQEAYDANVRPSKDHKKATNVNFELEIRHFTVDEYSSTIDLHVWTRWEWTDDFLKWTPSEFDDIDSLKVLSDQIWTPDITTHSASIAGANVEMPLSQCWIFHRGTVFCAPKMLFTTQCESDYSWWPYDAMNCTLELASWAHSTQDLKLQHLFVKQEEILIELDELNSQWEMYKFTINEHETESKFNSSSTSEVMTSVISYNIVLQRHAKIHSAIFVTVVIVLMSMTLVTLWLDPKSSERMIVVNLNFVFHLLGLLDLQWRIPFNGNRIPKLILFYHNSFMLATFSLILTTILRHLQELTVDAPLWISSTSVLILKSRVGQILLVSFLDPKQSARIELNSDDNTNLVSIDKRESTWRYTSIIISWLAFSSILFAYIIMLIVFIPTSISSNPYDMHTPTEKK